jgi:small-conductance mechanosensitive channel
LPALIRLVLELGLILVTWLVLQRSGMLDRLIPQEVDNSWSLLLSWAIRVILPLGVLTMLVFVALRAFGYIGFAQWLLERVAWTVVAVFLIVLIHWWIKRWIGRAVRFMQRVEVETRQEHGIAHDESPGWIAVDRILRLCLGIVAIAMLGFLVLHIWGIGPQDLGALLAREIAPGSQRTWMDLLKGALQVSVVLVAGRMLHDYLVFAYFPRKKTEVGVRYGAIKLLKLVVILIAVLVGVSAIGLNMSAMTVFAGGAGVGLSFALKDILGNFFSGLILLFGEAVRVDDIIEVGGVVGKVEAIRLRATVIRALDGNAVVIPNQQMIGERLTNKTKGMKIARLEVPVGVSYGSDLEVVEQVLLREARRMVGVLTEPGAFVRLTGFGDSSVDFQLFCYTDRTDDRYQLQHELRKRVFVAFRRKNIQIPFPQRDLHLDSVTSSATD